MNADSSRFRYSITVETQDDAVLFCLRGLSEFAERSPAAVGALDRSATGESRTHDGRFTFRFSTADNRGDFLGEATRLLAGKWTRVALSDDDPPARPDFACHATSPLRRKFYNVESFAMPRRPLPNHAPPRLPPLAERDEVAADLAAGMTPGWRGTGSCG